MLQKKAYLVVGKRGANGIGVVFAASPQEAAAICGGKWSLRGGGDPQTNSVVEIPFSPDERGLYFYRCGGIEVKGVPPDWDQRTGEIKPLICELREFRIIHPQGAFS